MDTLPPQKKVFGFGLLVLVSLACSVSSYIQVPAEALFHAKPGTWTAASAAAFTGLLPPESINACQPFPKYCERYETCYQADEAQLSLTVSENGGAIIAVTLSLPIRFSSCSQPIPDGPVDYQSITYQIDTGKKWSWLENPPAIQIDGTFYLAVQDAKSKITVFKVSGKFSADGASASGTWSWENVPVGKPPVPLSLVGEWSTVK